MIGRSWTLAALVDLCVPASDASPKEMRRMGRSGSGEAPWAKGPKTELDRGADSGAVTKAEEEAESEEAAAVIVVVVVEGSVGEETFLSTELCRRDPWSTDKAVTENCCDACGDDVEELDAAVLLLRVPMRTPGVSDELVFASEPEVDDGVGMGIAMGLGAGDEAEGTLTCSIESLSLIPSEPTEPMVALPTRAISDP